VEAFKILMRLSRSHNGFLPGPSFVDGTRNLVVLLTFSLRGLIDQISVSSTGTIPSFMVRMSLRVMDAGTQFYSPDFTVFRKDTFLPPTTSFSSFLPRLGLMGELFGFGFTSTSTSSVSLAAGLIRDTMVTISLPLTATYLPKYTHNNLLPEDNRMPKSRHFLPNTTTLKTNNSDWFLASPPTTNSPREKNCRRGRLRPRQDNPQDVKVFCYSIPLIFLMIIFVISST
jgi:hypothetical protein